MATNADSEAEESQETEVSTDVEAELRQAKAEAQDKPVAEETEPATQSTEAAAEESQDSDATLTTQAPLTPEKDLAWYKKAYEESTKEALRLKGELDKPPDPTPSAAPAAESLSSEQLWMRQKQDEEIKQAFTDVSAIFPQLKEPAVYQQFVKKANVLGRLTVETEERFPAPRELYETTALALGLRPDTSEQVGAAVKDSAAQTRTATSPPTNASKSKVTEEMIAINLKMYPTKSRQEIIEELEPHIH